jgi:hypothetical protein
MIRSLLTIVAAFGALGAAQAQGTRVLGQDELPYELTLDQVRLPTADGGGSITVRPCEACRTSTHAITNSTRFFVNGRELLLADFAKAVAELRAAPGRGQPVFVGVFVDAASQRVNRIAVNGPRR